MDWNEMMGADQGVPQGMPQDPYSQMINQVPPDILAAHRPPANPSEFQNRKTGWAAFAEKFMTDPNLQRAMGLAGAMMAQPIQPGQTTTGAIANAGVVGMNAYQVGQQTQMAQQAAQRKETREERELRLREEQGAAQVEATRTGTSLTRARIPGVEAESEIKLRTKDDAIGTIQLGRTQLEQAIRKGYDEAAIREVEDRVKAAKAFIQLQPGALDREHRLQIEEMEEKIANLRTQRTAQGQTARLSGAKARQQEIENEDLAAMTPEQRTALRSRVAGGSTSAQVQNYNNFLAVYDRLKARNPSAPEIQGVDADQFALRESTKAKDQDPAVVAARLISAGMEANDPEVQVYMQASRLRRQGGETPPNAGPVKPPAKGKEVRISTDEEYNALPSGTVFIGPDGKRRRKP